MRAMWRVHGKPGGPQPGLVGKPYTLADARARLAEVSGDRAFADEFFDKYVEGREVADYARLLLARRLRAAQAQRRRGVARPGESRSTRAERSTTCCRGGRRLFDAGLDQGDVIVDVDGKAMAAGVLQAALKARKPGDRLHVTFKRRGGATGTATITLEGRSLARSRDASNPPAAR